MQDYQQRAVDEEKALREKLDKLEAFMAGSTFRALPSVDYALMHEQRDRMRAYLNVLGLRIKRFT